MIRILLDFIGNKKGSRKGRRGRKGGKKEILPLPAIFSGSAAPAPLREIRRLFPIMSIIYWLKNKYPSIDRRIKQAGKKSVSISSISVAELYFGAYNSLKKEENIDVIEELFSEIKIIPFDESAGKYFGEIKASLKSKGRIISDSDIFIAATACSNNCILVTNNEGHFGRIENLMIENWAA